MLAEKTDLLELAAKFVNSTASHIFLTGKAGTGKTTFLRDLALRTHKNFVIIAPTGIAALNAQGVTIHSQFLLPFGTFVPDKDAKGSFAENTQFYSQYDLARKHPLNSVRKQVLRSIDLVIIDEVSMLRADILDAIDYRMCSVKGNFSRSFGGAQLLMIGDLYQLPPIVKDHEWSVLRKYYKSMHFFEALALRRDGMTYIELDKIFRQKDDRFISILNNLRNNLATSDDINSLNEYFKTEEVIKTNEDVITITTHNYKADEINKKKLSGLPGKAHFFEADVQGDFSEKFFPIDERIELKVGARIMFVKNDSSGEGKYYNGKLAKVIDIEGDAIEVSLADEDGTYILKKEEWENKKYSINESSKDLEEEVVGTFFQFPVKLAWAVTVHKSQGLTFEKAIIDVGQAFAPGQVYVALSRLRSLDGLILRTKINLDSISSDADVVQFSKHKESSEKLSHVLQEKQKNYLQRSLSSTFDLSVIQRQISYLQKSKGSSMEFEDESMQRALDIIQSNFMRETTNTAKFKNQLLYLISQREMEKLLERIEKGSDYYAKFIADNLELLLIHLAEVEQFTRTKTYKNGLSEIDQLMMKKLAEIDMAAHLTSCIVSDKEITKLEDRDRLRTALRMRLIKKARSIAETNPKASFGKSGKRKKKGPKKEKGSTYLETFALLRSGMSIPQIATERKLAESTIESHMVKGIQEGIVKIKDIVEESLVDELTEILKDNSKSLGAIYASFNGKHSYSLLRMIQAHLRK